MRIAIPDQLDFRKPIADTPLWGEVHGIAAPSTNRPAYADDETKKRMFGIEWAKNPDAFQAAMEVFGNNGQPCLWASNYWITDPIVVAARDLYLQNAKVKSSLLDKEQYAAKLLAIAEEKNREGTKYLIEAKERLVALKMYGEVMGHFPKNDTNNLIQNNFNNKNEMIVRFVEPDKKELPAVIEHSREEKEVNPLPIAVKLVG